MIGGLEDGWIDGRYDRDGVIGCMYGNVGRVERWMDGWMCRGIDGTMDLGMSGIMNIWRECA